MIEVGIVGANFTGYSISTGDETSDIEPEYIRWKPGEYLPIMVYADNVLTDAKKGIREPNFITSTRNIAWMIEPGAFSYDPYEYVYSNAGKFHYIFTHDLHFIGGLQRAGWYNALYVPCGGMRVFPHKNIKTLNVSCFTTDKNRTPGHRLRHEIYSSAHANDCELDFFGRGSIPVMSKREGLSQYRFSVVVESARTPGYFSEKLIDCFMSYTIPIYWGAQNIVEFFDPASMFTFENLGELWSILRMLSKTERAIDEYEKRIHALHRSAKLAQQYALSEDWAYKHYPWVFEK